MGIATYTKRPHMVQAVQYLREENMPAIKAFVGDCLIFDPQYNAYILTGGHRYFLVKGDWIIKDLQTGDFYPCTQKLFKQTYQLHNNNNGARTSDTS